jgi:hypothetical protein
MLPVMADCLTLVNFETTDLLTNNFELIFDTFMAILFMGLYFISTLYLGISD